jgi:Spy/CpxP family protein refolding chaperone
MKRINVATLGVALLIGSAGVAVAQTPQTQTQKQGVSPRADRRGDGGFRRGGRHGGFRRGELGGRLVKDLNLTDAQKAQAKTIREKYRTQFQALRTQMKPQFESIRALRQKGDTAGVRAALQRQRTEFGPRLQALQKQQETDFRNILTAEQRTKYDAAKAARQKRFEERQKNGGFNRGKNGLRPQRG